MNENEKLEWLLRCWELCATVSEGMAYCAQHPENRQVLSDSLAGLATLKNALRRNDALPREWKELLPKLENAVAQGMDPGRISREMAQFFTALSESAVHPLLELVQALPLLEGPAVQKLFSFYDQVPHSQAEIYALALNTFLKGGLSAPAEAFEHLIRLFEEQPSVLSGESSPHPDYVYRPSEQREFDSCPICGQQGTPYYAALSFRMDNFAFPHLPAKLWMKCSGCQNLYTRYFPQQFLDEGGPGVTLAPRPDRYWTTMEATNGSTLSIWSAILEKLGRYCRGKDLLEVGVGRGELLAVALEQGYAADAVEIVSEDAQRVADLLNIPVWNGDFLDYQVEKTYSLLMMGDVIEHVLDPERALRNAYRLLREDGVLWLSTPNYESSFSRMMKFMDPMWCEPYHISYFSYRGLKELAGRCGFAVREYAVSNRYNGSMELILTKGACD